MFVKDNGMSLNVEIDPLDSLLEDIRKKGDNSKLPTPSCWNQKFQLRPFQKVGASYLIAKKRFILGDPTGSGKTPQLLYSWATIKQDREKQNSISKLWVVTTKSATKQWEEEINKFLKGIKVFRVLSENPLSKRVKTVESWIKDENSSVLISNWTQFSKDWSEVKKLDDPKRWASIAQVTLDEIQKIKNPKSQVGQTANEILKYFDRVQGLTATLIKNRVHDAQAIVEAVCPGTISLSSFETLFCIKKKEWIFRKGRKGRTPVNVILGYRDLDLFAKRIAPVYLGRTDDELEGQRPDVVFMKRVVKMTPSQWKCYLEVESGALLEDPEIVGAPSLILAQQAAINPEF